MKFLRVIISLFSCYLMAEEGMWLLNEIPSNLIQNSYGVVLDKEWQEFVQKSCLRVSAGGSASFVSPFGLVMTNHHVGSDAISHLSSEKTNYLETGFYAESYEKELPCSGLFMDVLISTKNVTDQVNEGISDQDFQTQEQLRKKNIANIQSQALETGLQPEIICLYQGGQYELYLYKRYTDIRLVMAPEKQVAYVGGDYDNFEYPRYNFDVCFFRVYDQGKPLNSKCFFHFGTKPPSEKEVLFVVGHPGKTRRNLTADHLEFFQKKELPILLEFLQERSKSLELFSAKGEEQARRALEYSVANAQKAYLGMNQNFSKETLTKKREIEKSFQDHAPWDQISFSLKKAEAWIETFFVLEGVGSSHSKLYDLARTLIRLIDEESKENTIRLSEYVESEIPKIKLKLFADHPIYLDAEKPILIDSLHRLKRVIGSDFLQNRNIDEFADDLLSTKLIDLDTRTYYYENKLTNIQDPMVEFARVLDKKARAIRKLKEDSFDAVHKQSYAEISNKMREKFGNNRYPDATFSLRISYGTKKPYNNLSSFTTFEGLFAHIKNHNFKEPYSLPKRWQLSSLNKNTPLNFVSTHDIIGGNSGSPMINFKKEVVGLIFDGNAESLGWGESFDATAGRAISVDAQAILESLKQIYKANRLIQELTK